MGKKGKKGRSSARRNKRELKNKALVLQKTHNEWLIDKKPVAATPVNQLRKKARILFSLILAQQGNVSKKLYLQFQNTLNDLINAICSQGGDSMPDSLNTPSTLNNPIKARSLGPKRTLYPLAQEDSCMCKDPYQRLFSKSEISVTDTEPSQNQTINDLSVLSMFVEHTPTAEGETKGDDRIQESDSIKITVKRAGKTTPNSDISLIYSDTNSALDSVKASLSHTMAHMPLPHRCISTMTEPFHQHTSSREFKVPFQAVATNDIIMANRLFRFSRALWRRSAS